MRLRSGLLLLLLCGSFLQGQEPAPSKVLKEVLHDESIAVVRIKPSQLDYKSVMSLAEEMRQHAGQAGQGKKPAMAMAFLMVRNTVQAFQEAGGQEVYVLVSLQSFRKEDQTVLAIPLREGGDAKAITRIFQFGQGPDGQPRAPWKHSMVKGNLLLLGSQWALENYKNAKPRDREELNEALAGEETVCAALLPPPYFRRVYEEMLSPSVRETWQADVLGSDWLALRMDLKEKLSFCLQLEAGTPERAKNAQKLWRDMSSMLQDSRDFDARVLAAAKEKVFGNIEAQISGTRVKIQLEDAQVRNKAVMLIEAILEHGRISQTRDALEQLYWSLKSHQALSGTLPEKLEGSVPDSLLKVPGRGQLRFEYHSPSSNLGHYTGPDFPVLVYEPDWNEDGRVLALLVNGQVKEVSVDKLKD